MLVYLTARDTTRGEAALSSIQSDAALKEARALGEDGGMTDVRFHQLDIIHSRSIQALVDDLAKEHPGGLDFVVNNAGIAMDGFSMFSLPVALSPTCTPLPPPVATGVQGRLEKDRD